MRNQSETQGPRPKTQNGFTLIELLVVMVIISIILVFILNAGMDARRGAEERATQSLITKLETGLNDRFDALLQARPDYNNAHAALAAIYNSSFPQNPNFYTLQAVVGNQRAQVIAWTDFIKSEMPDVFFVQSDPNYPINFAGNPYPAGTTSPTLINYILPMGNSIPLPYGDNNLNNPAGTGVYGASYPIAAGIYKNLSIGGISYQPQGYDGIDNGGVVGLVDDFLEGVPGGNAQAFISALQTTHKHSTARSEMLYAILVEGRGPLGSVFNRDDFTDREVQDTDGDGLPEFVDAWGQPLQFFRWPLLYHSDLQRGQAITNSGSGTWTLTTPYLSGFEQREQNPLDLNQQLMAPAWWSTYNSGNGAQAFASLFHRVTEPYPTPGGQLFWDRGTTYGARRAFYSKFLIVSGGQDQQLGVFLYPDTSMQVTSSNTATTVATALIANENNALPFSVFDGVADFTMNPSLQSLTIPYNPSSNPSNPTSSDLLNAAQDDISNQNLQATGGIGGSG
jgi:prepilin-type N-terminal cleavage/methylation domain-containing protein